MEPDGIGAHLDRPRRFGRVGGDRLVLSPRRLPRARGQRRGERDDAQGVRGERARPDVRRRRRGGLGRGERVRHRRGSALRDAGHRERHLRRGGLRRVRIYTGPHTTASAWCTPILKDFLSRRISPPITHPSLSVAARDAFQLQLTDAFQLHPDDNASYGQSPSVAVGGLLGLTATYLINANRMLLLGRSLGSEKMDRIQREIRADPVVEEVYRAKSEELGPGTFRFVAEIEFSGTKARSVTTPVPIRPRSRGERRSLRTLLPGGASLRPPLAFNPRPRRLSAPLLTPLNSTPISSLRAERPH